MGSTVSRAWICEPLWLKVQKLDLKSGGNEGDQRWHHLNLSVGKELKTRYILALDGMDNDRKKKARKMFKKCQESGLF